MEFVVPREKMEADIESLRNKSLSKGEFYLSCCSYYRDILNKYRVAIYNYRFKDLREEIFFFKNIKQFPQVNFFYYSYLWKYHSICTITGEPFKVELVKEQMRQVTKFLNKHLSIYRYKLQNLSCYDSYYFTRTKEEDCSATNPLHDKKFTTPKDVFFSKCEAKEKYLKFLECELSDFLGREEPNQGFNLKWTGSKVDLTELLYALYLSGKINQGNITLKELVLFFEKEMGIELGDYHHTFLRLRDRSNPSKFIDLLKSSLLERMKELDS